MRSKKKQILLPQITVEQYAAEGKSLARVDGKVIFIEKAVPGDVVNLRLTKNKSDYAEAEITELLTPSALRITPFCQHFGVCGGCQWQMLPYGLQLQYKQQQVADAMRRIGRLEHISLEPIAGCTETRYYRNKLEYTFATQRYRTPEEMAAALPVEAPVAGFHARGFFNRVVPILKCHLQTEPTNEIRNFIAGYGIQHGIPFYNIGAHSGYLRNLIIRTTRRGQLMVNLIVGQRRNDWLLPLLQAVLDTFPEISTLLYTINEKRNDSLHDLQPQVYSGPGYITEHLENFSFHISPKSFFQTNSLQAETLYRITREFACLDGTQNLYDLYCGTGSIGIFCSAQAARITGVEMIEDAIKDARLNAAANGIRNAHFYTGDVANICNDVFFEKNGRPDVIITDPPRAGMHEKLIQQILSMRAPVVVYVSCNPATQARDLLALSAAYEVTRIRPVDMFPHTLHIENVVQLRLKP